MPSGSTLLAQEHQVRRSGSGLDAKALEGCWHLQCVWPRSATEPKATTNRLLRALNARLELSAVNESALVISNAVNLGALELRFRGSAELRGRRPLLQFQFDTLTLALGGLRLLHRKLPAPAEQRKPFFALIARDPSGWLAARGRGGGLALWRLKD